MVRDRPNHHVIRAVLIGAILLAAPAHAGDALDPATSVCIAKTIETLKAPISFLLARQLVGAGAVVIDYDSENEFGAMIRAEATCSFRLDKVGGFYLAEDPYWDWLSCSRTGKPESAGETCGAAQIDATLFAAKFRGIAAYPVLKPLTLLSNSLE